MNRKVRAIIVDGTEIMTSLTAVEIADRLRTYDDLKDEINIKNNIINEITDYLKYQIENLDFEKDTKAKMLCGMILVMLDKEELKESCSNED